MIAGLCLAVGCVQPSQQTSVDARMDDKLAWARKPLTDEPGDATRGRDLVQSRSQGLCVLCHPVPGVGAAFHGNLAPSLGGVGARLDETQLRARMMDSRRLQSDSVMPAYFRAGGTHRPLDALREKTLMNAQQIEDVVAYLRGLH